VATFGHGGYFSPQQFSSIGAYSELLSLEKQQWQVRSRLDLGYSVIQENSTSRFPLAEIDLNEPLKAQRNKGISANLTVEAQWRLSKSWAVMGYLQHAFAVRYEASSMGIQVQWRPGDNIGVSSDELMLSSPRLLGFAF
jgi:hypothetical protein